MIYYGDEPHPAHQGFAEIIGSDTISCIPNETNNKSILSKLYELYNGCTFDYDVLISEGSRPMIASSLGKKLNNTTLIYLCSDQFFYDLNFLSEDTILTYMRKNLINSIFNNTVDGIIAVSEFASEFMRTVTGNSKPIRIVHPYIQKDRFNKLGNIDPLLDSKTAITISSASTGMVGEYKGVDLMIEGWDTVRQKFPEATLRIVGEGHPSHYEDKEGVVIDGYVDSISEVMSKASLYIQPSRADTYPVVVLEALRAGLPSVVTQTTGNRSEIRTIDPKMVTRPTSESLASAVNYYFSLSEGEKYKRSKISSKKGEIYHPNIWTTEFLRQFRSIIAEINSG